MEKKIEDIPIKERLLLDALIGVLYQPLDCSGDNRFDHRMMRTGEVVAEALTYYGIGDDDNYSITINKDKYEALTKPKESFVNFDDYDGGS